MGIRFGLLLSNDKKIREGYALTLSHGAFHEVAEVGETAGLNMRDFLKITEYNETKRTIIKPNDVKKLLEICKKTLHVIQEHAKKSKVLLSRNEQMEYEKFLKEGKKIKKEDFEGTTGRLMAFIKLCEVSLKTEDPLVIQP